MHNGLPEVNRVSLVLMSQVRFGFLGEYNSEVGPSSPFRNALKWVVMVWPVTSFCRVAILLALKGLSKLLYHPGQGTNYTRQITNPGSTIYNKYTFEVRYHGYTKAVGNYIFVSFCRKVEMFGILS